MKTLNFALPFINLKGEAQGTETIGQSLAQVLCNQTKGDALKYYSWAQLLYKNEPLTLDPSDVNTLRQFVADSELMFVSLKAQLLTVIDAAK